MLQLVIILGKKLYIFITKTRHLQFEFLYGIIKKIDFAIQNKLDIWSRKQGFTLKTRKNKTALQLESSRKREQNKKVNIQQQPTQKIQKIRKMGQSDVKTLEKSETSKQERICLEKTLDRYSASTHSTHKKEKSN